MKKRSDLVNNTLYNLIIRIDFLKINNFPMILSNLEEYMRSKGFIFNTSSISNDNFNIEDPEALLTQEIIKSNIDKTVNYEYISQDHSEKYVLNEYVLIFEKNDFYNYSKIDKYLEIINNIIDEIIKNESEIKISRIGIKKQNQLFIGEIDKINDFIKSEKFPIPSSNLNTLDEYQTVQKNIDRENGSSNIICSIKSGKAIVNDYQPIDMYRVMWDIDCYYRDTSTENVKDKICKLNDKLFDIYMDTITQELYNLLIKQDVKDEELEEKGIFSGILKNENNKEGM